MTSPSWPSKTFTTFPLDLEMIQFPPPEVPKAIWSPSHAKCCTLSVASKSKSCVHVPSRQLYAQTRSSCLVPYKVSRSPTWVDREKEKGDKRQIRGELTGVQRRLYQDSPEVVGLLVIQSRC